MNHYILLLFDIKVYFFSTGLKSGNNQQPNSYSIWDRCVLFSHIYGVKNVQYNITVCFYLFKNNKNLSLNIRPSISYSYLYCTNLRKNSCASLKTTLKIRMKRLTDLIILLAIDLFIKQIWMDTFQNIEQCEYFKEWILLKTVVVLLLEICFYG